MRDPLVIGVDQPYSPAAVTRGYSGPLQAWYETNFDPTSGFVNRVAYEAFDWTQAQNLANYYTALGISANLKNEHGISTLTISDATGSYVLDSWQISIDRETVSIFENPLFLSLINSAAEPSLAVSMMRAALKNDGDQLDLATDAGWYRLVRTMLTRYYYTVGTGVLDPGATTYGPNPDKTAAKFLNALGAPFYGTFVTDGNFTSANMVKLKNYYDAYNYGQTDYVRGKLRLIHTANVPARWNSASVIANEERIFSISQLIAECTGVGFLLPLPNFLITRILNYVPDPISPRTPWFYYGALKSRADAVTAVNNRVSISTEYLVDNISTLTYYLI